MKRCMRWMMMVAALAGVQAARAGEYAWANVHATNYAVVNNVLWNVLGNWTPSNGWPNTPADTAVFTNLPLPPRAILTVWPPPSSVMTVGVVRMADAGYRAYITLPWSTRSVRFERDGGTPLVFLDQGGDGFTGSLEFASLTSLEVPGPLDVVVTNRKGTTITGVQFQSPLVGAGPINKYGDGVLQVGKVSSQYSGTVTVYEGVLHATASSLSNGTVVLMTGTQYTDALTVNSNFTAVILRGGTLFGEAWHFGRLCADGGGTVQPNFSRRVECGRVCGSGTLTTPAGGYTLHYCGTIAPGAAPGAAGTLGFNVGGGAQFAIGLTDAFATLEIDITGTGGVAGVDHDLVQISSVSSRFSPDVVHLIVHGAAGADVTNWFLVTQQPYSNGVTFASAVFTDGDGEVIYDTAGQRIGVIVVPEAGVWAAGAALAVALRRAAQARCG